METKELRLGNKVFYRGMVATVTMAILLKQHETSGAEIIKPIPLTLERLIKAGAKEISGKYKLRGLTFDRNTIGKIRFHWSKKVSYIDSVNDLQNLFFALKGYELDYVECSHCNDTGFDSYPNHSTSYPVCPKCN